MVIALIFILHIIFAAYVFLKKWKLDSPSAALIDLILIIIIFSVGWSVSTMFVKLIWEPKGFGIYFDRDTIALFLLTVGEFFFYKIYYKDLNEKKISELK